MKTKLLSLSAAAGILAAAAFPAHAQDREWVGATGSWNVTTNWSGGTLPVGSDEVWISNGGTATIASGVSAAAGRTVVGYGWTGNLLISGGLLTTLSLYVGYFSSVLGTLTITSGTLLTNNTTAIGWSGNGALNISGGIDECEQQHFVYSL